MLLKRIKLKNFRSYLHENEIEFAVDEVRNITLIHGENGVGKTALLNAILWAFFEKLTPNFRNPELLVNHEAIKSGINTCSVEIQFEEQGVDYLVQRRYDQAARKSTLKLWQVLENGAYSAERPKAEFFINSMLPSEMAEYFFFQGEGSSALEGKNTEGRLGKAIRDILGFRVPEALKESLQKAANETRKVKAAQDKSGKASMFEAQLSKLEDAAKGHEKNISETKDAIKLSQEALNKAEDGLDLIKNTDLTALRAQDRGLRSKLAGFKAQRADLRTRKVNVIRRYGWALFGGELASQSLDFIDESSLKGRLPEPYNQSFVDEILTNKVCICGACLEPGSDAWVRISEMMKKAANPILQARLLGIRSQISDIHMLNSMVSEVIAQVIDDTEKNERNIETAESDLRETVSKITLIPEEKIAAMQNKKNNSEADIRRYENKLGAGNLLKDQTDKDIEDVRKKLEDSQSNLRIIDGLQLKESFIQDMISLIVNHLTKSEKNIRLHVLKEVNSILKKFSRHDYKIGITPDDFKIKLLDKNDNLVGQGDGLNLLLNLTITAALIKFAAARKQVNDSILSGATIAPLVIDAPFGVLDDSYRNVVVEQLPGYTNQLVFFVSSSQWSEEMGLAIKDKLGKEYCLVMSESSSQGDKKIDELIIRDRTYTLSKYDQEESRTSILEVDV